jgi:hypothetical protein
VGARGLSEQLSFVAAGIGWYAVRPFPGYTGSPALANAASGAVLAARIVDHYAAATRQVLAGGPAPEPVLGWVPWLSLGGRIGVLDVPLREIAAPLDELDRAAPAAPIRARG